MIKSDGSDAFNTALNNTYSLDQFLIEVMRDKYNTETVKGKANAIEFSTSARKKAFKIAKIGFQKANAIEFSAQKS